MRQEPKSTDSESCPLADGDGLFSVIAPEISSQLSGGYWYGNASNFPTPPRLHNYGYGRLPSSSHQIAAQRLDQALFA